MLITEYIEKIKKTKTYQEDIIDFEIYKIEARWLGLRPKLPDVPRPDREHQIIVMDFNGVYPSIFDELTHEKPEIKKKLNLSYSNKILFIFIKHKPQILSIPPLQTGYPLGDGEKVDVSLKIIYKIFNVSRFWACAEDPIGSFQSAIVNEVKNFLNKIKSYDYIDNFGKLKNMTEENLRKFFKDTQMINANSTSDIIDSKTIDIYGIKVIDIHADIQASEPFGGHIDGMRHRAQVNEKIKKDCTFYGYSLMHVIAALDIELLENFYMMPYSDAMRKVHEELKRQKKSYVSDSSWNKIEDMEKMIEKAGKLGIKPCKIEKIEDIMINEMTKKHEHDKDLFTDAQFLKLKIDGTMLIEQGDKGRLIEINTK